MRLLYEKSMKKNPASGGRRGIVAGIWGRAVIPRSRTCSGTFGADEITCAIDQASSLPAPSHVERGVRSTRSLQSNPCANCRCNRPSIHNSHHLLRLDRRVDFGGDFRSPHVWHFFNVGWKNSNPLVERPMLPGANNQAQRCKHPATGHAPAKNGSLNWLFLCYALAVHCANSSRHSARWHDDCSVNLQATMLPPFTTKESAMIEFRWVALLTLWTMLIGPILDFTQNAPTAQATRAKPAPPVKSNQAH
jgi:hypothetical protein